MPKYKSESGEVWFKTLPSYGNPVKSVDRENRIIYGVSVCTVGQAKGHGCMLDEEFVENTVKFGNSWKNGVKSRFGHPSMSAEALGSAVGKFKNFYIDGKQAKADIHFYSSVKGADANIEYIMDMAEEDPKSFATSIVFKMGRYYKKDKDGSKIYEENEKGEETPGYYGNKSPEYASIEKLIAVDFVDEPAANPNGLYSENSLAEIAYNFLQENPKIYEVLQRNPNKLMDYVKTYTDLQNNTEDNMPNEEVLISELAQLKLDKASEISAVTLKFEKELSGKDATILELSNEIAEIELSKRNSIIASFVSKLPEDAEKRTAVTLKLEKLADKLGTDADFSEMAELIIKENDKRTKPSNFAGDLQLAKVEVLSTEDITEKALADLKTKMEG